VPARVALITGGAGFIGSHLTMTLLESGWRVRVLDNFDPQVHTGEGAVVRGAELVKGDVTDPEVWSRCLDGVTHVVHFAAAVGVGQSMYHISSYCRTNVLGTAQLLESLVSRKVKVEKLLVASSMSIYGEGLYWCESCDYVRPGEREPGSLSPGSWEPICFECGRSLSPRPTPETKPLRPSSVYSINKRDQEEMCLVVGKAYGVPTVALRFFNVYGPGQSLGNPYTGVAAIFSARLLAGAPPLVFEDGRQSRDFIHVQDIVDVCHRVLESRDVADVALNVGTGRPTTIADMAVILRRVLGGPPPQVLDSHRAGDIRHCYADISAIRRLLRWEPQFSFEQGIEDLAMWMRSQSGDARGQERAYTELRTHGLVR
jgi:dTDP-L-rhamnose 4-epimerase